MPAPGSDGSQLDQRGRSVLGDRRLVAKSPQGSRQRGWGDSNSAPLPAVLPAYGHIPPFTCGFSQPVVTAGARCAPLATGRVCTQRVPLAPVPSVADAFCAAVLRDQDRTAGLARQGPILDPGTSSRVPQLVGMRPAGTAT